jgi:hypothetical protein
LFTRIYRIVAAAATCLLAAVGVVVLAVASPVALVGVIAVGSFAGLIVGTWLTGAGAAGGHSAPRRTRHPHAAGIGTAAGAVAVSALLATAGSAALLGAATAPVFLLLLLGTGAGLWRHRAAWRAYAAAITRVELPAAGAGTSAGLNVRALCLAWQRSHASLHGLPAGPARTELVATRERLLDELEQRDPVGFRHWLHRGVHASSDPSHYLTENRPRTARTPRGDDSSAAS